MTPADERIIPSISEEYFLIRRISSLVNFFSTGASTILILPTAVPKLAPIPESAKSSLFVSSFSSSVSNSFLASYINFSNLFVSALLCFLTIFVASVIAEVIISSLLLYFSKRPSICSRIFTLTVNKILLSTLASKGLYLTGLF